MKYYNVTFNLDGKEHNLSIQAYSKYNAKTRLYKMHPSAQIIKIEEDQSNA